MEHYNQYFARLLKNQSKITMESKLKYKLKSLIEYLKIMTEVEAEVLQSKFDLRFLDSDTSMLKQAKNQFECLQILFNNVPLKECTITTVGLNEVLNLISQIFVRLTCQCQNCQPQLPDNANDYRCSFKQVFYVVDIDCFVDLVWDDLDVG